jgi:acetyl esterase/lipase
MPFDDRVDAELRPGLDTYRMLGLADPPFGPDRLADLRQRPRTLIARAQAIGRPAGVEVVLLAAETAVGTIELRILRQADPDAAMRPAVVSFHSGGLVLGSADQDDLALSDLVVTTGCVAVSVDYRLAPEYPSPAAAEDCYAAVTWVADHAEDLGVDRRRIAVQGSSGGGCLAAAVTLMARDRGGPAICFQSLIAPMLDDRNSTPSSHEFAGIPSWGREFNVGAWAMALGDAVGGADVSAYSAPARATDLSGLPPTFIQVGELEVFRDEDIDYAQRLLQAGVACELHVYPGAYHGSELLNPKAALSRQARRDRIAALQRILGRATPRA